ncbi:hypothetical protein [uncultured Brevundimonas sp.]|uniref:hypothetical protein n=1 Tax=uncultured Brevundimonas sp. TaxID=213418 RepID=UPI0030EF274D
MKATPITPRDRTGRHTDQSFINALNRRYALIKGRYETIEQECETVTGGAAALIEAQDRVESEKVLMKRTLDAIETLARSIDPDWRAGRISAIAPRRRDGSTGKITRSAANILRKANRPMTVRELARAACEAHGFDLEERNVARFDNAIHTSFSRKVGRQLGVIQGPPKRYFILEATSEAARQDRRLRGAASSPS